MNKTGIEYCDYTWNPATGCELGCNYCYARKIAERFKGGKAFPNGFKPTFHPERLKEPHKLGTKWNCPEVWAKGSTIFVCSMADLFGDWVPDTWINEVMLASKRANRHTYIFLTKNPKRYQTIPGSCFQSNFWFGASVTRLEDTHRIDTIQNRVAGDNKFISFEPLLGDPGRLDLTDIKQVIVGAQTNPNKCAELESILKICEAADEVGAKVFMKDSLQGRWCDRELRRELCWSVHK
jgi:protein gp37